MGAGVGPRGADHGEAELLVPKLQRRAPMDPTLERQMLQWHSTHLALLDELDGLLPVWDEAADPELGSLLADIVTELSAEVADHLDAIEQSLLPLADQQITPAEWLLAVIGYANPPACPGRRASSSAVVFQAGSAGGALDPLTRMAVLLGAAGGGHAAGTAELLAKVSGPARLLFRMVGREQYAREMRVLREGVLAAA
jgi:hypothetical protein